MGSPPPDRDPRPKLALTSAPDPSAQIQQVFYCFTGECFLKNSNPKGKINLASFQKIGYHRTPPCRPSTYSLFYLCNDDERLPEYTQRAITAAGEHW
jgi:hypothetical protein